MNAKELQEKYAADAAIAKDNQGNKPKVTGVMPIRYLEHVRRQALKLTEMVGIHKHSLP